VRVEGGTLAQVVTGDDEDQPPVTVDRLVLADASDQRLVDPGGGERRRHVDDLHTRRPLEQRRRLRRGDRLGELGVDGHGVAGEDRDTHTGPGDPQVRDVQDLARLVAQLLLLIGLQRTVVDEVAGERQCVEGDGGDVRPEIVGDERRAVGGEVLEVVDVAADLLGQRLHPGETGPGDRLVAGDVQAGQAGLRVQRAEDRHGGHGRAVRVGDDAPGHVVDVARVDLRDDERDLGVLPPGAGVVDHGRPGLGEAGGVLTGGAATGGEQGDVDALQVLGGGRGDVLDDDLRAAELDLGAGGPGRGEEPDGVRRELALGEDGAHDAADLAGRADDGECGHGAVLSGVRVDRPRVVRRDRTALGRSTGRRCGVPVYRPVPA
jgi:hypothetical protein